MTSKTQYFRKKIDFTLLSIFKIRYFNFYPSWTLYESSTARTMKVIKELGYLLPRGF